MSTELLSPLIYGAVKSFVLFSPFLGGMFLPLKPLDHQTKINPPNWKQFLKNDD